MNYPSKYHKKITLIFFMLTIFFLIIEPKVFAETRPRCNSILHLFGEWLFEAALIGVDLNKPKSSTTCKSKKK